MAVFVVDTNVPIVANGDSDMSADCQQACIERLLSLIGEDQIALDDEMRIVSEYLDHLDSDWTGQGVGDQFLKWVLTNQATERCIRVEIIPRDGDGEDYEEFPDTNELSDFDKSDKKFVAVACAVPEKCEILQASDSKWIVWNNALAKCGVVVDFVCEEELLDIHKKKQQPKAVKRSFKKATKKAAENTKRKMTKKP